MADFILVLMVTSEDGHGASLMIILIAAPKAVVMVVVKVDLMFDFWLLLW